MSSPWWDTAHQRRARRDTLRILPSRPHLPNYHYYQKLCYLLCILIIIKLIPICHIFSVLEKKAVVSEGEKRTLAANHHIVPMSGEDAVMQIQLRQVREACGLSQQAVAVAVGCTRGAISHWECGRYRPTLAMITRLAQVLGVPEARLLHLETRPANDGPRPPRRRAS